MKHHWFFAIILLFVFLIAACAPNIPAPPPTATPTAPTSTPTAGDPQSEGPAPATEAEPLFLEVTAPEDETVVMANPVQLQGRAPVDALITVNGSVVAQEADGSFTMSISLEEGPNFIEVIASNMEDDEEAVTLSVIYFP